MASESKSVVIAALIANGIVSVAKFIAAALTGSASMLAEGFHSVADTGNQVFLLRGLAASRFDPSPRHPFGRGKEVYFWSFMVAVMLFVGGSVLSLQHGWEQFRDPHELESLTTSFVVLGLAALLEAYALTMAVREFNRRRGSRRVWRKIRATKDSTLLVVLFEDAAAMLGLAVAAAGLVATQVTGDARWDGIASMLIGLILAGVAFVLAFETKALLVGEAATRHTRSAIRAAVLSLPEVESIDRLLTMHLGPEDILVNIDVDFTPGLSDDGVESTIDKVEAAIKQAAPEVRDIFVELQTPDRG